MSFNRFQTNKDIEFKATNMDDRLKMLVTTIYENGIREYTEGNHVKAIKNFISLYYMIKSYDFQLKEELQSIIDVLLDHLNSIGHKPLDMREQIQIQQKKIEIKELINILMERVPMAYSELGLWFRIIEHRKDFDRSFSNLTYGDDLTNLENKKKDLLKLDKEKIIELMIPSVIHKCWGILQIENAV